MAPSRAIHRYQISRSTIFYALNFTSACPIPSQQMIFPSAWMAAKCCEAFTCTWDDLHIIAHCSTQPSSQLVLAPTVAPKRSKEITDTPWKKLVENRRTSSTAWGYDSIVYIHIWYTGMYFIGNTIFDRDPRGVNGVKKEMVTIFSCLVAIICLCLPIHSMEQPCFSVPYLGLT